MAALVVLTGAAATTVLKTPDPTGVLGTVTSDGDIDHTNPFFQSLGANGRSCATCHIQANAWGLSPEHVQERFAATNGTDPLFRTNDGSNSPAADVSTVAARRAAYSMLLNKAVFRIGISIPPGAEFVLTAVDDPYHNLTVQGIAAGQTLALFRRPLPATNLRFLSAVMWDGRETVTPITAGSNTALHTDLAHQAVDATAGHAQGTTFLTPQQQDAIVAFELGLTTAQVQDEEIGSLGARGGQGGPVPLSTQPFSIGINDPGLHPAPPGGDPTFNPPSDTFTIDSQWAALKGNGADDHLAAARGEAIFNTYPITISGVAGINDVLGKEAVQGTCATCHDTPNVGNHSVSAPLNIGIADASRRTPDQPLYTLVCTSGALANPAKSIQTTDPGRALISGKCADIGKFKGPILRGLAARAPYFHNGSAATLLDAVNFYNTRFHLNLSAQEKQDLVAFLRTL